MKKAFTMIELVFVIVVIGILAAVIIPRIKTNQTLEAAIKLLSDIRYTQHLSMINDKFDTSNTNWFKNRWKIVINNNKYSIMSDALYAKNPLNKQDMKDINLHVSIALSGSCLNATSIGFDHLGKPYINIETLLRPAGTNQLIHTDCILTITGTDGITEILKITPETGYIYRDL